VALGFLADAFSSAHMFVPVHLALTGLQGANVRAAHAFFASEGAYVVNGAGEAWQTFGDGLLEWYDPTRRHVQQACVESVREVHLVRAVRAGGLAPGAAFRAWADSVAAPGGWEAAVSGWLRVEPGAFFYEEARLPGLLRIPMPVSASWSVRLEERDEHGFARRRHFPRLRESAGEDPLAGALDPRFVYPRSALPEWMVPELAGADWVEVVRTDPNVASVHYVQARDFPPSLAGVIVAAGGGALLGENGGMVSAAAGYAWEFAIPLGFARSGFELEWYERLGDAERRALAPYLLLGLRVARGLLDGVHVRLGYAFTRGSPLDEDGYAWGVGASTPAVQLPFTYAGLSLRLGYAQFRLEDALDGLQAQLVLQ
jgi:hypothetical protein